MKVDILITTNGSEEERKNLILPQKSINEFLGDGFSSNMYEGTFIQKCLPRSFDPDCMQIITTITDLVEFGSALSVLITGLIKLLKKSKGYGGKVNIKM